MYLLFLYWACFFLIVICDIYIFAADTHRTVQHSIDHKKTTIQKLKKELEQIEKTTAKKLEEIDESNRQLKVGVSLPRKLLHSFWPN